MITHFIGEKEPPPAIYQKPEKLSQEQLDQYWRENTIVVPKFVKQSWTLVAKDHFQIYAIIGFQTKAEEVKYTYFNDPQLILVLNLSLTYSSAPRWEKASEFVSLTAEEYEALVARNDHIQNTLKQWIKP